MQEMSTLGFATEGETKEEKLKEEEFRRKIKEALRETFKPEFLNRLDDIMIFKPLSKRDIEKIVTLQVKEVEDRLKARGIELKIADEVKKYLVTNGFDREYGARPIKRLIQKVIVDALADKLIKGDVTEGQKINISMDEKAGRVEISV